MGFESGVGNTLSVAAEPSQLMVHSKSHHVNSTQPPLASCTVLSRSLCGNIYIELVQRMRPIGMSRVDWTGCRLSSMLILQSADINGQRSFTFCRSTVWNSLPAVRVNSLSLNSFKRKLQLVFSDNEQHNLAPLWRVIVILVFLTFLISHTFPVSCGH